MSSASKKLNRIYQQLSRGDTPTSDDRKFLIECARRRLSNEESRLVLESFGLIRDPDLAFLIEPYLQRTDAPDLVKEALWALCRSGRQLQHKDYILRAVNPGFTWDTRWDVRAAALHGAGEYLRDHKDQEFAQMIVELADRNDDPHLRSSDENDKVSTAKMAAAIAMGGDPEAHALHDEEDVLRKDLVARFLRASGRLVRG